MGEVWERHGMCELAFKAPALDESLQNEQHTPFSRFKGPNKANEIVRLRWAGQAAPMGDVRSVSP
jgi:hypothetical protein